MEAGCALRGDMAALSLVPNMTVASEADWYTEYLDSILSVRVIDDLDMAIAHIDKYGSSHTDSIVTESHHAAHQFFAEIDSAIVMHNASTQFAMAVNLAWGQKLALPLADCMPEGQLGPPN